MRYFVLNGSQSLGAAIAQAGGFAVDPHEEREFEFGEHKSRPLVSVRGQDVYVLHAAHGDERHSANDKLIHLLWFIAAAKENGADRVTAIVPYLPYSRKDRQTKPRDPVTTRYVAQLFEAVETDMLVTLDVHNPAAFQNAFRCRTAHLSAAHLFAADIAARVGAGPVVFFSPDSGGVKRVQLLKEAWEALSKRTAGLGLMEKRRSGGRISGELFAGDVAGADVIILDDLIVSGETLVRAARACQKNGAKRVWAYATHALFTPEAEAQLLSAPLERIVTTNSAVPLRASTPLLSKKIDVLSIAPLVAGTINRLHGGGSIHRLLDPGA